MKDIKHLSVIELGLLGGSISLAVLRSFARVKVIGYSHRPSTRTKARKLGCSVKSMTPKEHDRIFANVSHLPHIAATALIDANKKEELKFAGKGFIDTSRIASTPANI
ncbi:MAG: prephenate dehydrogenase dimerization domain-containing protein [Planctomycetota bacterium]|jgi:prephenate dehydrogenase